MNVRELAVEILRRIDAGTLDPDAVVVRPLCTCDQDVGYVEARHIDQVVRMPAPLQGDPDRLLFGYGNAPPGDDARTTIKLG
jgi:hypothetical protein